ncbi:MAG: sugar phosphate isomerase/epimerase family protein [Novosphingobium sp.]
MRHPLAIELITALGQDPVEMVHLAADLGVPRIGLALNPVAVVPEDAKPWNLRTDAAHYRAVKAAIADRGVEVVLGEGFLIHPQMDMAASEADFDLLAELGTRTVNCVGLEPDVARCHDQFAMFARLAAARGMAATIEFMPFVAIDSLAKAVDCANACDGGTGSVLFDSMHVFRTGTSLSDIAALDPAMIGHVQLCDARSSWPDGDYMTNAKFERLVPGEGDLPLRDFLRALPDGLVIGLEVPEREKALSGVDYRIRISDLLTASRIFTTDLL